MVSSATAWGTAIGYAQNAFDEALDPVYADAWEAGDNGGFGFEPWNFDGSYNSTDQHSINSDSEFNDLGTAWTLSNTLVTDIARAGRGFDPLQVGQTIRVIVDNPNEQAFFRGYFVRFNTRLGLPGGGNICYDGEPCSIGSSALQKLNVQMFEYQTFGQWGIADGDEEEDFLIPLFDRDTAEGGMQIDLTITGTDTYEITIDPLGAASTHTQSGTLMTPGEPIDWIEFTFFNTQSDENFATDFYIRSLEIIGEAPPDVPGDYNENGVVDAADYTVWRDNLGKSIALPNEDATLGMVTSEDYDVWKSNFGQTAGSGAASAVPEPSIFVDFVAAFVAFTAFAAGSMPARKVVAAESSASDPSKQR